VRISRTGLSCLLHTKGYETYHAGLAFSPNSARMALGAQRRQVLRLVMKEGAAMALPGSLLGLAATMGTTRVLAARSAELAQTLASNGGDPVRILGAPLLLISVAAIACYLPASATIDPLAALREE
jgi:putative ABC transport system permease protein